jgi:hypothetical protein
MNRSLQITQFSNYHFGIHFGPNFASVYVPFFNLISAPNVVPDNSGISEQREQSEGIVHRM